MASAPVAALFTIASLDGSLTSLGTLMSQAPPWMWVMAVTAPTTAYLLASMLLVGTNHPVRWLVGGWVGIMLVMVISSVADLPLDEDTVNDVFVGPTGLLPALGMGDDLTLGAWLAATSLWLALAVVGTLFASFRYREG
jgi:hypothetical protein